MNIVYNVCNDPSTNLMVRRYGQATVSVARLLMYARYFHSDSLQRR